MGHMGVLYRHVLLSKAVTHVRTYLHVLACYTQMHGHTHTHSLTHHTIHMYIHTCTCVCMYNKIMCV